MRRAATLVALLAAVVLAGPAAAARPAAGVDVATGRGTMADGSRLPGATMTLGFWLDPVGATSVSDAALRTAAIAGSGLPVGRDGAPVIGSLADARVLRRSTVVVEARANRAITTPFLAAARALGVRHAAALETAPLVLATVTPTQAALLAGLSMVASVEASGGMELATATAYPTIGGPAAYADGFRGTGVRVAIVEYARIDFSLSTLASVPRLKLKVARSGGDYVCRFGDPTTPDDSVSHMSRVAAIAAGRSSSAPRGVASGATIVQTSIDMPAYDNLETAARMAKAIECAITVGDADVINLSLSEPRRQSYLRTYLDHLVATYGVFVAVAAGNAVYGTCPDGEPVAPASAWNVLTVGGTDDRGTRRRSDDRLWSENGRDAVCTHDPRGQAGDDDRRIKPEISAPARNIGVAGYPLSSGTSYAAPMVSGAAATLIARDPALAARPHVVKAILIASSLVHRTPRTPGGGISTDREGAGTLAVDWAHALMSGRRGAQADVGGYREVIVRSSPTAGSCRDGQQATVSFPGHAGRKVRVAITWHTHARKPMLSGRTMNRRKSDLDLVVRRPGGGAIDGRRSSRARLDASNTEWFDFRAPETGTYTIIIRAKRWDCDLLTEPVGLAWIAYRD